MALKSADAAIRDRLICFPEAPLEPEKGADPAAPTG